MDQAGLWKSTIMIMTIIDPEEIRYFLKNILQHRVVTITSKINFMPERVEVRVSENKLMVYSDFEGLFKQSTVSTLSEVIEKNVTGLSKSQIADVARAFKYFANLDSTAFAYIDLQDIENLEVQSTMTPELKVQSIDIFYKNGEIVLISDIK